MKSNFFFLFLVILIGCSNGLNEKALVVEKIGQEEYDRLMNLSLNAFDQGAEGFRKYGGDYEVLRFIIPEYIQVHALSDKQSRLLNWHLGQIHAFNDEYEKAIAAMEKSYHEKSLTWNSYVDGSIAFLEKDKPRLEAALQTLSQQEDIMNIEFLEKFVKYFDLSYAEAYSQIE